MNQEKMGKFIASLRKEKGITQYDLAEMIPVSREAVSKWERGKRCPDPQSLIKLSEIFDITINELLYGARQTKNNSPEIKDISIKLYENVNKKTKLLKIFIFIIISLIILFLGYYFFTTYNSLRTYLITYDGENIDLNEGILVMSNEELYFNLGKIISDLPAKSLDLFYKDKNGKNVWIMSTEEDPTIIFTDFNGYNRYINFNNIDYIINNLYLNVNFEESSETIKLKLTKNFSNNYLFPKKEKQYKSVKLEDIDYDAIINKINKKLTCNDDFCIMDDDKYEIVYMFSNNLLMINTQDGNISFVYDPFKKSYTYIKYSNNNIVKNYNYNIEENKLECKIGKCNNYEEEVKDFLKIVESIIE